MQTKLLPLHPLLHQEFHSIDLSVSTLADGSHPPLIPPTPLLYSPSKFAFSSKGVNWRTTSPCWFWVVCGDLFLLFLLLYICSLYYFAVLCDSNKDTL